ncbi:ankyrin repeat and LEM domain-containing protein 1-like, partial [Limulus polyphemus]|uniref:Ankyrin repeat and LEM domain-containing protein 1-like n=1 Tax=Limulus polyphemus TaxID=6850 RepID=A0ABM1S7I5_LIMPO
DADGCTLLHLAVGLEDTPSNEAVVALLLQHGANPNIRSIDGLTPVHISVLWGNVLSLKLLLSFGGNPWLKDSGEKDAFQMALETQESKCIQVLEEFVRSHNFSTRISLGSDVSQRSSFCSSTGIQLHEAGDACASFAVFSSSVLSSEYLTCSPPQEKKHSMWNENANENICKKLKDLFLTESSNVSCTRKENCLLAVEQPKQSSFFPCIFDLGGGGDTIETKRLNCEIKEDIMISANDIKLLGTQQDRNSSSYNASISSFSSQSTSSPVRILSLSPQVHDIGFCSPGSPTGNRLDGIHYLSPRENAAVVLRNNSRLSASLGKPSCHWNSGSSGDEGVQEYLYTDEEEGIALIERHYPCSNPSSFTNSSSSSDTVIVPLDLQKLNNSEIRKQLLDLGDNPGPVQDSTRQVYLHRLTRLKSGVVQVSSPLLPNYPPEISHVLESRLDFVQAAVLEKDMCNDFDNPGPKTKWREGTQKTSFNYLLLDPRVTRNLPGRALLLSFSEQFQAFINAIFYVGKGTRARPYSHLYEAIKILNDPVNKPSTKVQHILDIWASGEGVISLHCFQNVIPVEAYTREACMVEALGLSNLTNIKRGDFYGVAATFNDKKKRQLGAFFLFRSLHIFLNEGERQLKPFDIR